MKEYSTFLRSPELKPHHQMQFRAIPRTRFVKSKFYFDILLTFDQNQCPILNKRKNVVISTTHFFLWLAICNKSKREKREERKKKDEQLNRYKYKKKKKRNLCPLKLSRANIICSGDSDRQTGNDLQRNKLIYGWKIQFPHSIPFFFWPQVMTLFFNKLNQKYNSLIYSKACT